VAPAGVVRVAGKPAVVTQVAGIDTANVMDLTPKHIVVLIEIPVSPVFWMQDAKIFFSNIVPYWTIRKR
jgi:hypothetical protein